jgi:hypothetical protein
MILPLDEPLAAQHYGGKAARLSTCLRAGLPVPAGIALHSDLVARVEGLVTPDRYTLTPGGALLVRQLGSKEMAIIPGRPITNGGKP